MTPATPFQMDSDLRGRLLDKLRELFRLDRDATGLDRILRERSQRIMTFLEQDLLTIKDGAAEVYDHLLRFFDRYYESGDFVSRRHHVRETPGQTLPYAIPYAGEEVKLHWANADQYYVKTFGDRREGDHFVHRDLGGFLRRELDFYVKNEVLDLDDPGTFETATMLRSVAGPLIDFLAQLEDFLKKIWLKKKLVVETRYFVTLDRIEAIADVETREWLLEQIAGNEQQHAEWRELFGTTDGPHLSIDTGLYDETFTARLLDAFDDLDELIDGWIFQGDNFQVLRLAERRWSGRVSFVYLDPPYNTGGDGFVYKDTYPHATWLSMMRDRLELCRGFLAETGVLYAHIDENEVARLRHLADELLGRENFLAQITWKNKYGPGARTRGFGCLHEYVLSYSRRPIETLDAPLSPEEIAKYRHKDARYDVRGGYITQPLATRSKADRPNLVYPIEWNGTEIWPDKQWIWSRQRLEAALANDEVVIREKDGRHSVRFKQYLRDERGVMRRAKPLTVIEGPFTQDGTREVRQLFGTDAFAFPKPSGLAEYLLNVSVNGVEGDLVLDAFAGSGTTAHAVINLNRRDGGHRKFVLAELGDHCRDLVVPRLRKAAYAPQWDKGSPTTRDQGRPLVLAYARIESYEDCLDRLAASSPDDADDLITSSDGLRADYTMHHMLDAETRLRPDDTVDRLHSFNLLLGLQVKHIGVSGGYRTVEGDGVLIIWRPLTGDLQRDNETLDAWFEADERVAACRAGLDVIYVNGSSNVSRLRRGSESWTVRLIEDAFETLTWEGA